MAITPQEARRGEAFDDVHYSGGIPVCNLCFKRYEYQDGWIHPECVKAVTEAPEPAEHTASWLPHMKGLKQAAKRAVAMKPETYDDEHGA